MAALGLSSDPTLLNTERIGELFQAVDNALARSGLRRPVEIVVVGGAAIALQWNEARTTNDIDVVSEGIPAAFWEVAEAVGSAEGLSAGWLNAAARIKAPPGLPLGNPTRSISGRACECTARAPTTCWP